MNTDEQTKAPAGGGTGRGRGNGNIAAELQPHYSELTGKKPLGAAILAKLLAGQVLQIPAELPPPWPELASAVQACPPGPQRAAAFSAALAGKPDAESIWAAVFAANPDAPLPEVNSDPWKAYTLADAYQDRPPVQYIAGKLFELPSLNIVYGAPGTLKSFLLQDLAVCVAAGKPWLAPAPWTKTTGAGFITKQAPVIWIDFDNGARRTLNRFESLGRALGLSPDTPITFYSMPDPWLHGTDKAAIGYLIERIKKAGARLVIIDNLGNVSGDADENSAEMGGVMSHFRQLAEETGAAVVLIHHQRKSNGMTGRAGDSLRGHSSIEAALDLALMIEREPFSESVTIKATKVRGAEVLPFGAVFTFCNKPDSDDLDQARFYGLAGEDNQSDTAVKREILAALENGGKLNQTQLIKAVQDTLEAEGGKVGKHRIREIANRLASEKKIRTVPGQKTNELLYELAG